MKSFVTRFFGAIHDLTGDLGDYLISKGANDTVKNKQGLTCYEVISLNMYVCIDICKSFTYMRRARAKTEGKNKRERESRERTSERQRE